MTSRFIGGRSKKFADKSVLELGCGLGLCGIVAGTRIYLTLRASKESPSPISIIFNVYSNHAFWSAFVLSRLFLLIYCFQSDCLL